MGLEKDTNITKRRIVLVGPPGVGKSTIVRLAQSRGIYAVDIEDIHNELKKHMANLHGEEYKSAMLQEMKRIILDLVENAPEGISIYGAGSYGSSFPQDKIEKILLLPPWEVYEKRWKERDSKDEAKKLQAQKGKEIYEGFVHLWKSGERKYDRIIQEVKTAEETLTTIIEEKSE